MSVLSEASERFAGLPTTAKLLLILTAVLLPIGLGLAWVAWQSVEQANELLRDRSEKQAEAAARALESLVARNALALRIAANGRMDGTTADPCVRAGRSLTIVLAVAQQFELETPQGDPICEVGDIGDTGSLPLVAPGHILLRTAPDQDALVFRVGVIGGMATGSLPVTELREATLEAAGNLSSLSVRDARRELQIIEPNPALGNSGDQLVTEWPIGNGHLVVEVQSSVAMVSGGERLLLSLPVLMWIIAAAVTWLLVRRLLVLPLRRLQRAVTQYQPGEGDFVVPGKLGPATEIEDLRDAFERAVVRVEESEREMAGAVEGQRRLVREVHHRVKNNLQVVASLLNIHGRSAESQHAQAAYSAIARRVGALSIVHRNHFAEMEETRGISLRPLLSELAAELRAGAPEAARALRIDLEMETAYTTQEVAVSISFLVTEIVEHAMLTRPDEPVEITLRRTSELSARLAIASPVLNPEQAEEKEKIQFERIISGLAKQLRSEVERKLGRYSVDLPVFPAVTN